MSHRPLRVLQVVQTLEVGGVEQLQVTLARFHDKRRLALEVCSFRSIDHGPLPAQLAKLGIPLTSLHGIRLYHPAGLMRLARLVRHRRIDVLHAHLSTPTILAAAVGCSAATLDRWSSRWARWRPGRHTSCSSKRRLACSSVSRTPRWRSRAARRATRTGSGPGLTGWGSDQT